MILLKSVLGALAFTGPLSAKSYRLVLDLSVSSNAEEDVQQRQGLAFDIVVPGVLDALSSSALPVTLSVCEWSGRSRQRIALNWRPIDDPDDLYATSAQIRNRYGLTPGQRL